MLLIPGCGAASLGFVKQCVRGYVPVSGDFRGSRGWSVRTALVRQPRSLRILGAAITLEVFSNDSEAVLTARGNGQLTVFVMKSFGDQEAISISGSEQANEKMCLIMKGD